MLSLYTLIFLNIFNKLLYLIKAKKGIKILIYNITYIVYLFIIYITKNIFF